MCSFSTSILLVGSFNLYNRLPYNLYNTVLVETLNPAQSINYRRNSSVIW